MTDTLLERLAAHHAKLVQQAEARRLARLPISPEPEPEPAPPPPVNSAKFARDPFRLRPLARPRMPTIAEALERLRRTRKKAW